MPKGVVTLVNLFDLQNQFQGPPNTKVQNSMLSHEKINILTDVDPNFINLGIRCSPTERKTFINMFRKYQDVFSWMYNELKTYETLIIQHVIPIKGGVKPLQKNIWKVHPTLNPFIQKELKNLLDAQIIFKVRHSTRVSNLVPVRQMSSHSQLWINLKNMN